MSFTVSDATLKHLDNFARIGGGMIFQQGTTQKTVASDKRLLATAEFEWPQTTPIYDLNQFLGVLSLFSPAVIDFGKEAMTISNGTGGSRVKFRYSSPNVILAPPSVTYPTNDPGIVFTLDETQFEQLRNTSKLLDLDIITLRITNDVVNVVAWNKDIRDASNIFEFTIDAAQVEGGKDFSREISFQREQFALFRKGAYKVSIADWPYAFFEHATVPVSYLASLKNIKDGEGLSN